MRSPGNLEAEQHSMDPTTVEQKGGAGKIQARDRRCAAATAAVHLR